MHKAHTGFNKVLTAASIAFWVALVGCCHAVIISNAHAQNNPLPDLGDSSISVFSPGEQRKLGRDFMVQARRQLDYVDDAVLNHYLSALGRNLVRESDSPNFEFHFYLVNNKNLNAFAALGGHITLYTGLIEAAENEDELAAVMSHEIAHVTQHHLSRLLVRSKQTTLSATAGIVAAILLGGQAGAAALAASNAVVLEDRLEYSRDFEREADALGMQTLQRANYDPIAMASFFQKLQRWSRLREAGAPEFLRTHPLSDARISSAETRARSLRYQSTQRDSLAFELFRNRIKVLFGRSPEATVQELSQALLNSSANHSATTLQSLQYGKGLALAYSGHYEEATNTLLALANQHPQRPEYPLAVAEIELLSADFDKALTRLQSLIKTFPDYLPAHEMYARVLINTGSAKAKLEIRKMIRKNTGSNRQASLYALLARAAGEAGPLYESYQARAEYFYINGQLKRSISELERAKKETIKSDYTRASINSRLAEIKSELDDLSRKKRR